MSSETELGARIIFVGGAEELGDTSLLKIRGGELLCPSLLSDSEKNYIHYTSYVREVCLGFDEKYEPFSEEALVAEKEIRLDLFRKIKEEMEGDVVVDGHYGYLSPQTDGDFKYVQIIGDAEGRLIDEFIVINPEVEGAWKRGKEKGDAWYLNDREITIDDFKIKKNLEKNVAIGLSKHFYKPFTSLGLRNDGSIGVCNYNNLDGKIELEQIGEGIFVGKTVPVKEIYLPETLD